MLDILIGPPDSEIARHWRVWESHGDSFAAPELLGYEMSNAIWQLEKQQKSRETTALHALMRFEQMPIAFLNAAPDHTRALEYARRFKLGKTYDMYFVSLAERLGVTLWTCDRRFSNAVSSSYSEIHILRGEW